MSYSATVIEVMLASPSDVVSERDAVRGALAKWNANHSRDRSIVLLPVGWETHSAADLSGRPQQLINDRVLSRCDLLIGIFWSRIGSPTGSSISGTVEEIQEHHRAGKPVMLYFSTAPLPQDHDPKQFAEVKNLKQWAYTQGLVGNYDSPTNLAGKLTDELNANLRDNAYLQSVVGDRISRSTSAPATAATTQKLSADALRVLKSAAKGDGEILALSVIGGTFFRAGDDDLNSSGSGREVARWRSVLAELDRIGLIEDRSGKGEIFQLTHDGYEQADDPTGSEPIGP